MRVRPVTLTECRRYVADHHRHNLPPRGWLFGVGVEDETGLRGIAVASRPVARKLDDGRTVEVTRTCTDGARNANSMLYGAIVRAAKALGYDRVITYTLQEESGASLKASGFTIEALLDAREAWVRNDGGRYQTDLFGNERRPAGPKIRWVRELRPAAVRPVEAE